MARFGYPLTPPPSFRVAKRNPESMGLPNQNSWKCPTGAGFQPITYSLKHESLSFRYDFGMRDAPKNLG